MQVDQQTFVSAYIERQQRAIADLTNKVVMLETQLMLAQKKIQELTQPKEEIKPDSEGDFKSAQVKEE
jgi:putative lipoic acid-binding regulatory protein